MAAYEIAYLTLFRITPINSHLVKVTPKTVPQVSS